MRGLEHAAVGFFGGANQHLGIALRGETDDFGHGFHGHARGVFARFGAAHAVGQDIEAAFGVHQAVILVIGSDASLIRQRECFQHVRLNPSVSPTVARPTYVTVKSGDLHAVLLYALETPATHARYDQVRAFGFCPALRPHRGIAGIPGGRLPVAVVLVEKLAGSWWRWWAARSAAMAFNRLVDSEIDARNPRTSMRHLPAGLLSRGFAWAFVAVLVVFLRPPRRSIRCV